MNWMEMHFVPVASKIGSQRHLGAIRDGFATIMPLIIAGSLATLLNNFPFDWYQNLMNGIFGSSVWRNVGGNIYGATFMLMSVLAVFSISYSLAKSYNSNALRAGFVSLGTYFCFVGQVATLSISEKVGDIAVPAELVGQQVAGWGWFPFAHLNASALFGGILIALVTTEVFVRLTKTDKLAIKMPENVPPAVAKSFSSLFPTLIIIFSAGIISTLFIAFDSNLFTLITETIQKPFLSLGNTVGAAIILPFFSHLFWSFGLHGSNIMEPIMQAFNAPAIAANVEALAATGKGAYILTKPFFDGFVYMGGSGVGIAIVAAIFVGGRKNKHYMTIAELSAAPAIFNINESLIFGLPIVLNPIMIIPFVLSPMILSLIAFTATSVGFLPYTSIVIPWTTPPIMGGFLATNGAWQGAVISAVNLLVAFAIYLPFVKMAGAVAEKEDIAA